MIRRYGAALRFALMTADGLSGAVLFVLISQLRFGDRWQQAWADSGIQPWLAASAYALTWVLALWFNDMYRLRARWTVRREVADILRTTLLVAVAAFVGLFIFKLPDVSRLFLVGLFASQVIVTAAARLVIRETLRSARQHGLSARFVLVVGAGPEARSFVSRLERRPDLGLHVVGYLVAGAEPGQMEPVLGTIHDIEAVLHSQVVDEVAICLPAPSIGLAEPITRLCEEEGRIVRIPLRDVGGLTLPGGRLEDFDGLAVLSLVYGPDRIVSLLVKRLVDVVGSAMGLLLLSPLLFVVAVLIVIQDGAPVLFLQARVGLHGRIFRLVKFRSMAPDAEDRLAEVKALNEIEGPAFKITDDPRISPLGRILRRTSIDEIPQLWNVLIGSMSLVGPRPPLPEEVADYDLWHRRRLSMKPGITGLWQISARREHDFDRWVQLDLDYIDRWSLWLDFKILIRTIPAVMNLEGR